MRQGKMKSAIRHPEVESRVIDLNTAEAGDLAKVAGIGHDLAQSIIGLRPIERWDDLKRIPSLSDDAIRQLRNSGVRLGQKVRRAGGL